MVVWVECDLGRGLHRDVDVAVLGEGREDCSLFSESDLDWDEDCQLGLLLEVQRLAFVGYLLVAGVFGVNFGARTKPVICFVFVFDF